MILTHSHTPNLEMQSHLKIILKCVQANLYTFLQLPLFAESILYLLFNVGCGEQWEINKDVANMSGRVGDDIFGNGNLFLENT